MKIKVSLMTCFVLMFAFAVQATNWTGSVDDDWTVAGNWDSGVPTSGVNATVNSTNAVKIYSGDTAASNTTEVGATGDGASLTIAGTLSPSNFKIANSANTSGTVTISGGTISMTSYMNVGTQGTGTLIVNSGTITGVTNLSIPSAYYAGVGYGVLELNGGTINAEDIFMNSHGSFDVCGGVLAVAGNQVEEITSYYEAGYILCDSGNRDTLVIEYSSTDDKTYLYTDYSIAYNPSPADGSLGEPNNVTLTWTAGDNTSNGDNLYFGTDYDSVFNATTSDSEYKGNFTTASYSPGTLATRTTYYWRVDGINSSDPNSPYVGDVWSFSTGPGFTDEYLENIQAGFETRRNQVLDSQISSPYPDFSTTVWGKLDFALSALYRNTDLTDANNAIIAACEYIEDNDLDYQFLWEADLFFRIYELFNQTSKFFPGRLTSTAEADMCEIMWLWAKSHSKMTNASMTTWELFGSENRDSMELTGWWGSVKVLRDVYPYNTYTLDDGYTAQQHYQAWNSFLKEYFLERSKRGFLVEIAAVGYSPYTLQMWYNCFDFTEDPELKELAKMSLDLWWADWAQEQINTVRGGGKARVYQEDALLASSDSCASMAWFYFGEGNANNKHPKVMCLATSEYRLPLVVMDIALDVSGRGNYESSSKRLGLMVDGYPDSDPDTMDYFIDSTGGILKYSYCTPDFIIGTLMFEKRDYEDWAGISCQNRWVGAIFADDPDSRIFPQCEGLVNGKTYNQYWTVQNEGTLIVQKIDDSLSYQTGDMRVYFSDDLITVKSESNNWVFINGPSAYAAVRPAWGGYTWDTNDNNWMLFNQELAPAIIEVVQASDYASFAAFQTDVLNNSLTVYTNDRIVYEGLQSSGTFTFYTNSDDLPKIDGTEIDLYPNHTFQSPFLNEDLETGLVGITKDGRELKNNFDRIRGWWKLDESTGTTAYDETENCVDGSLSGCAWKPDDGIIGGALEFDGIDDYVYCGTDASLDGDTDFTVTAWVKTDATVEQTVVQQRYTWYNGEYWMRVKSNGKVNFAVYGGGYQFNFDSSDAVNDGRWHNVTIARDCLKGYIYIDGQLNAQATGSSVQNLNDTIGVVIGADMLSSGAKYFDGLIDDVRIYSSLLNDEQLLEIYNSRIFAWWKLDNESGTFTGDSSQTGCVGEINGNPVWSTGIIDGALDFDGSGDYVDFGTGAALEGEIDFTVMAWVKTAATAEQTVVQQRDTRYNGEYWMRLKSDGKVNFAVYRSAYQFNFNSTGAANDGDWHHIAIVRKGLTGYIYIDGELDAQSTGTAMQSLDSTIGVIVGADTLGGTKYFDGLIDDVRIYKTSLDESEIDSIYSE